DRGHESHSGVPSHGSGGIYRPAYRHEADFGFLRRRGGTVSVGYRGLFMLQGDAFRQAVEFVAMRKPYMSILPDLIESIRKAFLRMPVSVLRLETFCLPSKPALPEK